MLLSTDLKRLSNIALAAVSLSAALFAGLYFAPVEARHRKNPLADLCELVPAASTKKQRVLHFPAGYSLGDLRISACPEESKKEGTRGPAKGDVIVPPGKMVKFIPGANYYRNPAIANELPADAFDSIVFANSSLDDTEDGLCDRALSFVGHFKSLIELSLDRSDASDEGAAHAAELPELQKISAMAAGLQGKCFKQLAQLQHLCCLHLPRNILKDDNLKYLAMMPSLKVLNVNHCHLTDAGVKHLANCANLQILSIGDNPDITDKSIKYLQTMKNLRSLGLFETSITFDGVLQLKTLPLMRLELPSKKFSEAQLSAIDKAFPAAHVKVARDKQKEVDPDTETLFAPLH